MNNMCKHKVIYVAQIPNNFRVQQRYLRKLKLFDGIPKYEMDLQDVRITYDELTPKEKKRVDQESEVLTWMRCSEHCGNTMREAQ
jgi:hypothetical protein